MPYELFWRGSIPAFDHYMEKERVAAKTVDRDAWMHGVYFAKAIAATMSKQKYPDHPILLETIEKAEKEYQKSPEENQIVLFRLIQFTACKYAQRQQTKQTQKQCVF